MAPSTTAPRPVRDSLELASLASSTPSASPRASVSSSGPGTPSSRKLSSDSHRGGRLTHNARSFSVTSAFDFSSALYPLSSTGPSGYTALGAPTANGHSAHTISGPAGGGGGGLERHKSLTFFNGVSLIIGMIIGSGIFSAPAQVNINAGSPGAALIVWVIAGVLAWTGAASFAELGGALPLSGGSAVYLSKIYGDWAGFIFTWVACTVLKPGSLAIICIIFGEYIVRAAGLTQVIWLGKLVAFIGLAAVTTITCVSTKAVRQTTNFLMLLKFIALLGVGVTGLVVAVTGHSLVSDTPTVDWKTIRWFEGTSKDASGWAVALYAGLFAYDGWETLSYTVGEFINPRRDLARSIHTSVALVVVSYLLANISYLLVLPFATINSSNTVAVAFGRAVFGPVGAVAFAVIVSLSCYGSMAASTFTSSRLIYAASREGLLPSVFSRLGWSWTTTTSSGPTMRLPPRNRATSLLTSLLADDEAGFFYTPILATLCNAVVTAVYVAIGDFSTLTTFYGVAGYTFYFFTVLGLIVLRVREPDLERPYRCWLITPVVFCAVSIFLLSRAVFAQPLQTLIVVAFCVAGLPLYALRLRTAGGRGGRKRGQEVEWRFWKRWGRR